MTEEVPVELAENLAAYSSQEAIDNLSIYRLFEEEKDLFSKYYKPGDDVLDLACGMGRTTLLLHEMGVKVRGVDRSDAMIAIAKRRLPYLDLHAGSYDAIDEPDASFTHVLISHNGIDYAFPEAQRIRALKECARVVKPGGTFLYSSHNLKSMHLFSPYYGNRKRWKLKNCLKAFRDTCYIDEEGIHTFYASAEYVVRQTEALGLKLVEMKWLPWRGSAAAARYFSPYIHYVFTKPTAG